MYKRQSTKGNANISGATINGTISATNTNGKVSLSDCTVNGRISVWIGGKVDINSGVHIYTTGYDSGIYVGTMGGTVNIYDGVTVETSGYNSHAVEVSTASGTANIYGGSFTSQNGRGLYVRTDATVNLYGGTFSGNRSYGTVDNANTDGTVRDLLAEGHAYYTGEAVDAEQLITSGLDGSKLTQSTVTVGECSHIDEDTSGSCDVCGTMIPIATVSMNGEVTEFGNINEAWAAALEGSDETPATLTLLKSIDMKETNLVLDSDSNIILEMNEGVTLSGNVGVNFGVKEGVIQVKAGTLTVNSGTISNYRTGSAYSYGIVVEGTASNTANLYIKGSAKITSEYMAVYSNSYSRIEVADNAVVTGSSKQAGMFVDGELTVNGGEISGGDAIRAWGSRKNVTINGGTIKGQTTGIYVYSDDTEVEITGGYIEGKSRGVLIHSGHLNISAACAVCI